MRTAILALAMAAPGLAFGQDAEPTGGPATCGQFLTMDLAARIGALTAIEPLGDEIDPGDEAASKQWAEQVANACAGSPDRQLSDAAAQALGGD